MKLILLLITFLITSNHLSRQADSKILAVRKIVQIINNGSGYQIKTLGNDFFADKKDGGSDNGQSLKGYFKDGHLKKMIFSSGLSYCMKTYEYYFSDTGLVFVFEKEEDYPEQKDKSGQFTGLDYTKLVPAFEGRYYFENGKVFQKKTKGHVRMPNGNHDNDLLNSMKGLVNDLRKSQK